MSTTTRKTIRYILCVMAFFLMVSCRVNEDILDGSNDSKFLWFIPVSGEYTFYACIFELTAVLLALGFKYIGPEKAGWHSEEIRRAIRNADGKIIGYYDTGEVKRWQVSAEEAEKSRNDAERIGLIIRIVALTCVSWGMGISWVFTAGGFWFFLFWVPICAFRIYVNLKHLDELDFLFIWEKVFWVICLICLIVYANQM